MNLTLSFCCFNLLLVFDYARGKPTSDLQSLTQILEELKDVPPHTSEEMQDLGGDADKSKSADSEGHTWDSSDPSNLAMEVKADVLALLFKDLFRPAKRSWSRYRKGGLRSCFGVRLDRIGSFSGLGC
ncbi:natriuretic peptide A-like [Corythoichthys intestinalis]|uniref:natriuretic peptide A-like n=1 Tax=Corythoichthys intestinalis TaxID=161448 RepID=UPI0025A5CCF7|nr:natriuretic peptide A-like [Corythoichthys intestinalis]XP_061802217.1 C-type natriuretic peptide 3-like [Nerophis lumbriciformis]